ncbi:hypothetical protein DFP93_11375 [Aneurinibacillus soli]|uniref:Uncharacterized protein n=1 Tax=Aneurinibacillus soli TaxID=1500254 RepID=A0A0U5C5R2_9BACL|nr:hypothetical protein DFP93_11375 [Aneurinibacillus soli]BAU27235.1 hypothetical protein CB4_01404 [Aneurinibacillus soli]
MMEKAPELLQALFHVKLEAGYTRPGAEKYE